MKYYLVVKQFIVDLKDNIQALIKLLLVSNWKPNIPKPNAEKLVVLANGPSLTENLDRLLADFGSDHIMVCNLFYKTEYFMNLKPKYYTILDPSFRKIDLPLVPEIKDFYTKLYELVNWHMTFFCPYLYKKDIEIIFKELKLKNEYINIVWYNSINFNGETKLIRFLFSRKMGMPSPGNVSIPCIMLGVAMNFKKIAILGIDLKYHENIIVDENNEFLIRDTHFYDDQEVVTFRPMYLSHVDNIKMDANLFFDMCKRIFNSLKIVKLYAEEKGTKIVNYSKTSFIDQFPKV